MKELKELLSKFILRFVGIIFFYSQYPRTKDLIEGRLQHIISTVFSQTSKTDLSVIELTLTILNKLLNMKIDLQDNIEELICGIASLYHSPQKVRYEN